MDVASYTQARYGRLLEHAIELGAPDGQASAYVDQVLLDQRRRIKRAHDPDPMVREALARAIRGEQPQSRELLAVVLVLGVVLASIGLAAILYAPPPQALPSLFGYTGAQGQALLESRGYDVLLRPARACDPPGLVLATSPAAGALVSRGGAVSIRTAVTDEGACTVPLADRAEAWAFVAWARDLGPEPRFAEQVLLVADGEDRIYDDPGSGLRDRWAGALRLVADAAERPADTSTGLPALTVLDGTPPATWCGLPRAAETGDRAALRLVVDDGEGSACPLTVDLYRTGGAIDTVVVHHGDGARQ